LAGLGVCRVAPPNQPDAGKRGARAAALALSAAAVPASAHDDDYDHGQHYRFHREVNEAHQRAHEYGFNSEAEHRAFHRALRYLHRDFHEDHPGTWHDHYRRWW